MGDKPALRPGGASAQLKVVTRTPDAVDWVRNVANDAEVPLGAVFDALVDMARQRKHFKKEVLRVWFDRYAEEL